MTTTSKQLIQIFGLRLLVAFEYHVRPFQYKHWLNYSTLYTNDEMAKIHNLHYIYYLFILVTHKCTT